MPLDRAVTDRLLVSDADLADVDPQRFHLDLSEIVDEARKIASLPDAEGTASDLLVTLAGSIAHLTSHWERLAQEADWSDAYAELLAVSRSVNADHRPEDADKSD